MKGSGLADTRPSNPGGVRAKLSLARFASLRQIRTNGQGRRNGSVMTSTHLISPLEQTSVAIDLETTGLRAESDAILEVGAVRFRGDTVLDTWHSLVNPGREIPDFIQRYTGITPQDVRRAPSFAQIRDDLAEFIGRDPIVGHSVNFDLGFLESHGLPLVNPAFDTLDLATVFLPFQRRYSLSWLIDELGIRPEQSQRNQRSHRAVYDALAHKELYVKLLRIAGEQDSGLLAYMTDLARRSNWPLYPVLSGMAASHTAALSSVGPSGLNHAQLAQRLEPPESLSLHKRGTGSGENLEHVGQGEIHGMLGPQGPFAQAFAGFEHRPEQEEMLDVVTDAIYNQRHLVIEGGTGVGKSLAYLLPAALFAVSKGQRVVVSTNTINLQEQLISKDIPALQAVLEDSGILEPGSLKVALLKGRGNYLCLRRWGQLSRTDSLSVEDAKLLAKTSVWLQDTKSGDRGEINLLGRDAATWNHISAGEKGFCLDMRDGSPCFLRAARQRAEQAHIIVVNHALLMTDLAFGGGLIPEYNNVIIDEAHHLEEAATNQFGFELPQNELERAWEPAGRLAVDVRQALAAEGPDAATADAGHAATGAVEVEGPRLRESWEVLFQAVEMLHRSQRQGRNRNQGDQNQLLITPAMRSAPAWAELHLAWENLDARLTQARNAVGNLRKFLDSNRLQAAPDQSALSVEADSLADGLQQLAGRLQSILGAQGETAEESIHWLNVNPSQNTISLHSAPLDVSGILAEKLFEEKDCVVLTSATLSSGGNFEYLKRRVGFPLFHSPPEGGKQARELLVGSPFDYERAAQALIPEDMPQPNANGYVPAVTDVLSQLGRTLEGRTMALFTSHSSLRAVAQRLRPLLEPHGIPVLAQGIDGSAPYIMSAFADQPNSVILGTASFWEGVDMPSGLLKALVITRLPFQVPSDPIVQSRSALYDDPFAEYSVPNAVLRFRQGIGRLIRNRDDRGNIVVLDSRIISHGYGRTFQDSMPPCRHTPCLTANVGMLAARWLEARPEHGRRGGRRGARLR